MTPDPSLPLRFQAGNYIGTTAFFRNRPLLDEIFNYLGRQKSGPLRVLFHACSIGAEVYSVVIHHDVAADRNWDFDLTVDATDISPQFLGFAARAVYDEKILPTLRPEEQACFDTLADGKVQPRADIRDRVTFLPAGSYVDFTARKTYDVVFLMNALMYVDGETQGRTFDKIGGYNSDLLVTTGFHLDRIKTDLMRNAYRPITDGIADIHEGWTDRRRRSFADFPYDNPRLFTDPLLDDFEEIEDFDYKLCALFRKTTAP